jgi:hypothetical protein
MLAQDQEVLLFAPQRFVADGDLVVALGRYRWRVRATEREIASEFAHVFTVSNGRIVRFQEFMDTAAFVAGYAGALTPIQSTTRLDSIQSIQFRRVRRGVRRTACRRLTPRGLARYASRSPNPASVATHLIRLRSGQAARYGPSGRSRCSRRR